MDLVFCCAASNDLYRVLAAGGICCPRCDSLKDAVRTAPPGAAVLALADAYPRPAPAVQAAILAQARDKELRLLLEYPSACPGLSLGAPQPTHWERAVVSSSFFAPDLPQDRILALHGCYLLPATADADATHLVAARVAGYHRAVYGLPEDIRPLLFDLPGQDGLVCTTKLSQFVTARYGPASAWQCLWQRILACLCPGQDVPALCWDPVVGLQYGPEEPLAATAEEDARGRSMEWFRSQVVYSIDQKKGAIEGFEAAIDHRGRQLRRTWARADCIAETAMAFAWDARLTGDPSSHVRAGQMLDYVLSAPDFYHDDPTAPDYGLINWYERGAVYYGDDNARVLLAAMTAARLLDDDRWDERLLRAVLANLRTTGPLGFRQARVDAHQFQEHGGWAWFQQNAYEQFAPHYQAYLWAVYLWVYGMTGDETFLIPARDGLTRMMAAYPADWHWTNGLTQEIARVCLPLAFLLRVDDTGEHRGWLERMTGALEAQMQPCGAIHELLGETEHGAYGPPRRNEAYGTAEATLIQQNGDPACDLLYTANYAFLGLHEAAAATGWEGLRRAADRMAAFFCRIQVRSAAHPYLDGAWMRSFDTALWEYWGSSADLGWGAWSVESGWTNTWIAAVLSMRQAGETLWSDALSQRFAALLPRLRQEMLDASPPATGGSEPGR